MKAVRPIIVSNSIPYLQMTLVGSHSMSEREREKEGKMVKEGWQFCQLNGVISKTHRELASLVSNFRKEQ